MSVNKGIEEGDSIMGSLNNLGPNFSFFFFNAKTLCSETYSSKYIKENHVHMQTSLLPYAS